MKYFSKLPQFILSINVQVSAFVILCAFSTANAQVNFREPQSETINFQRSGLDSAVSEVACSAGQPQLQKAVIFQYEDEKPQYIYGDDGSKTCVSGNCMKKPSIHNANVSNGDCASRAKLYRTKVFGPDKRDDTSAFIPPLEYKKYASVGAFECKEIKMDKSGKKVEVYTFRGSGTVLGGQDTVFTDAHIFISRKTCVQETVADCRFVLLRDGRRVDTIDVKRLNSPWQKDKSSCGDPSLDYGVIKLVRPIDPKDPLDPMLKIGNPAVGFPSSWNAKVDLISYHNDVKTKKEFARRTSGNIYELPANADFFTRVHNDGFNISKPGNIVVTDYASNHGSSGGAIFEGEKMVGVHMGTYDPDKRESNVFSRTDNFNYFLLFDKDMAKLVLDEAKKP